MAINKEDLIHSKFLRYKRFIKEGTKLKASYWFLECKCGAEYMRDMGLVHAKSLCISCTKRKASTKHGMQGTPEYIVWDSMLQRCTNPNNISYKNYGSRGIRVCESWQKFPGFFADMGNRPSSKHTLERNDNNGDYGPKNCRWATWSEQHRNKRNSKTIKYQGKECFLIDLAKQNNIKCGTLWSRIYQLGWRLEEALTTPVKYRRAP